MKDIKLHWDSKFKSRAFEKLTPPEPFLIDNVASLNTGKILDIACGDGRNSIFLAKRGFEVTGIDISSEGLSRLHFFANKLNLKVQTICKNIEVKENNPEFQQFNNVFICRYKPTDIFLDNIPNMLTDGGIFIYITFNSNTLALHDFPAKFCLEPGELKSKEWPLILIKYQEIIEAHGIFDAYIFKKN